MKDFVEITCTGDDVFVKIRDIPMVYGELTEYIRALDHLTVDYALLKNAFKRQRGVQVCISKGVSKQQDRFSRFKIEISEDHFTCFLILLPIRENETLVSFEAILEDLKKRGVVFGVQQQEIQAALENRQFKVRIEAAVGKSPIPGRDGSLTPVMPCQNDLFKYVSSITSVPDFVEGSFLKEVRQGEKIADLVPATPGEPGYTIFGKRTKTVPGEPRDYTSPKLEIQGREVFAAEGGCCKKIVENFTVKPLLIIEDLTNQELRHNGSVKITGNVSSCAFIKVSGDLEIHGSVTETSLEVSGNLIIHGNLMTTPKRTIVVEGDFVAQSISNALVTARNIYVISSILNCELRAAFVIATLSSAGRIVGGHVMAGSSLRTAVVGRETGVATRVSIATPEVFGKVRQRMVEYYSAKIDEINAAKTVCQNKLEALNKSGVVYGNLQESFTNELARLDKRKNDLFKEVVRIKDPKLSSVRGEVSVKKLHPMSILLLGKGKRVIEKRKENVRFYLKENSIMTEELPAKR